MITEKKLIPGKLYKLKDGQPDGILLFIDIKAEQLSFSAGRQTEYYLPEKKFWTRCTARFLDSMAELHYLIGSTEENIVGWYKIEDARK
jgi:hypothetical protein